MRTRRVVLLYSDPVLPAWTVSLISSWIPCNSFIRLFTAALPVLSLAIRSSNWLNCFSVCLAFSCTVAVAWCAFTPFSRNRPTSSLILVQSFVTDIHSFPILHSKSLMFLFLRCSSSASFYKPWLLWRSLSKAFGSGINTFSSFRRFTFTSFCPRYITEQRARSSQSCCFNNTIVLSSTPVTGQRLTWPEVHVPSIASVPFISATTSSCESRSICSLGQQ